MPDDLYIQLKSLAKEANTSMTKLLDIAVGLFVQSEICPTCKRPI